ncbi:helix-turn-helix transcriptional regulator [Serinibacter salmoneus]|nr:YafY family protein [Serinibacter salmoneus]
MLATSARLLSLLSVLQRPREWTSAELAERLDVTTRTVRADVAKLRSLGYPVQSRPGLGGGYRLSAGSAMPPLLMDDDEAVAVAIGLGIAAGGGIDVESPSLTALAKLEQVMPSRLRHRVSAIRAATSTVGGSAVGIDLPALGVLASAVRGRERTRFDYTRPHEETRGRHVEPHRLIRWEKLWYLLAWDLDRDDWRIFRVDRAARPAPTGATFIARPVPGGDAAEYVTRSVIRGTWACHAVVLVHASAELVRSRIGFPLGIEALGPAVCRFTIGGSDADELARRLMALGADVEVLEGGALREAMGRLAERCRRAAGSAPG